MDGWMGKGEREGQNQAKKDLWMVSRIADVLNALLDSLSYTKYSDW